MSWRLAPALSYVRCGEEAVFLDVAADRYFVLPSDHTGALELALSGVEGAPLPIVTDLERRGILHRGDDGSPALPATAPLPTEESVGQGRASIAGLARATVGWRTAVCDLRHASLRQLRNDLDASMFGAGDPASQASASDLASIVADFRHLSRLVSVQDRCLPLSIAFVRIARRRGHRVSLVFGVRLQPFQAHCWAQAGPLVLNDRLDVVCGFSPVATW